MMLGVYSKRLVRCLVGVVLGCTVLAVVGCDDRYPTDLPYPARSDLLVIRYPKDEPTYTDSPGQLDRTIALIKSKQGETLDPKDLAKPRQEQILRDKAKQGDISQEELDSALEQLRKSPPLDQELTQALVKVFGSPANPTVADFEDAETGEAVAELALDARTLALGSQVYRRHCLHCHGVAGDGRGPSGPWLNPHPRDYRQGQFKFTSSTGGESRKPRRNDLYRTVFQGIEGTSMPAFNLLANNEHKIKVSQESEEKVINEIDAVVSYVIHLSIRGEAEFNTIQTILEEGELKGEDESIASNVEFRTKDYLQRWQRSNAESGQIKPEKTPEYNNEELKQASIRRGYILFTDPKGEASCIACHADYGRQVNFRYDSWGTLVRPANLTTGVYRGGRRPIDLFWRVKGGIVPSGMSAAAGLKDEDIWDVVNFLQALPHPRMLPPDLRGRIYVREDQVAAR